MIIYDLKTECLTSPNAVDNTSPRFSWKIQSERRGVVQNTYRIIVKSGSELLWDSGVTESCDQLVKYEGTPLKSRQRVTWSVEVETVDENGERELAKSLDAEFYVGLLERSDWIAKWIDPESDVDVDARKPVAYLRKRFSVKKPLKQAVIYQSAHGLYEFYLNGKTCTEDMFKPGLTSYYYRIQYQRYDVTDVLCVGENVLAVMLADGWWRGVTGGTCKNNFGCRLAYIGQIELTYEDGEMEIIASDETFKTSHGGLFASDMMMGDVYDANEEALGWKEVGFDDSDWHSVCLSTEHIDGELIASRGYPIRRKEAFTPTEFTDENGDRVLDFSQNIAGVIKARFRNTTKGQRIKLSFGEDIKKGVFNVENCCHSSLPLPVFQEITYVASGEKEESYSNEFSFFGFRYVKIEGYDGEICDGDFVAYAVYSDMPYNSEFKCSEPLINKLVDNSRWSQKGNFLDVATDCPTREKNAWTGDAQVFIPTSCYFADAYPFYEKWLIDQKLEQYQSGKVNMTFPATSSIHDHDSLERARRDGGIYELAGPCGNGNVAEDSTGWGDSAVWLPYIAYKFSGDKTVLENQYDTAKKYVDYELSCAKEQNPLYIEKEYNKGSTFGDRDGDYIYDTRFHYGEWNEWNGETEDSGEVITKEALFAFVKYVESVGNPLVSTAYMCSSCKNLSEMAKVLGKKEDEEKYGELAKRIRVIYDKYLIGADGTIESGRQAPYVRALAMDLAIGDKKAAVMNNLITEIKNNGNKLNTGFLSTPFLLPVLADNGRTDLAFELLENKEVPGWLAPILSGATTNPESWDGFKNHKNSLNHYSFGSVCEFLFSYVGGIKPCFESAGFKRFEIKPTVGGSLSFAYSHIESPYGEIVSSWGKKNGETHYHFEIPVNTTADVTLPSGKNFTLSSGKYDIEE